MRKVDTWKSDLPRKLKIPLFRGTIEIILLLGAETWTITKNLKEKLDGCYTRLILHAQNISWEEYSYNE